MRLRVNQLVLFLSLCFSLLLTGCVSLPAESVSDSISSDELSEHVAFLSQPALRGRSTGSWESQTVRNYLTERLELYGCQPWASAESFELPFSFGTNVIGVLPGTDPQLANEIILISSHYDHLKPNWFSYYPGACDNASSVAVLLEIAEKLSRPENRPKRSVCLAFFDAEERFCLGSFAFTCRDDYDDERIAAVINMDLLGRDLLDAVDNSLIVTGTEDYGPIESHVAAACSKNDLHFIPFETALVGPVGDHVAFTLGRRPVLFFSCGIYKDYHQTTDTPDKINYEKLGRESAVIEQTLLTLANAEPELFDESPAPITQQKTDSFSYILNQFKENKETFKLDPNDIKTLDEMIVKIDAVDLAKVTRAGMIDMERSNIRDLLELLDDYHPTLAGYSNQFIEWSRFYAINPDAITRAGREMIEYYLTNKLSILNDNQYIYRDALPVSNESWGLTRTENGKFFFGFVDVEVSLDSRLQLLMGSSFDLNMSYKLTACRGSLDNILSYAIVGTVKDPNNFYGVCYPQYGPVENKPAPDSKNNLMTRRQTLYAALLETIQRDYPGELSAESLQKYKKAAQFMIVCDPNQLPSEDLEKYNKFARLMAQHNTSSIFLEPQDYAKKSKTGKKKKKVDASKQLQKQIDLIMNPDKHIVYRVGALNYLANRKTRKSLTAIVDVLEDDTMYEFVPRLILHENYPLRYHPIVTPYADFRKQEKEKYGGKVLGQIAYEKLKEIIKKDFGDDKAKWQQWLEKKY